MLLKRGKKAQVTIFIIVAVVLVVLVGSYFIFKDQIKKNAVPADFQRIENSFLSCAESQISDGILLLETQGGYVFLPEYQSGSMYSPFSSYMNFMGIKIPYWYYLSAANLPKTQVPTKDGMEKDLDKFLQTVVKTCSFSQYVDEGYEISTAEPEVKTTIQDNVVKVNIGMRIDASRSGESYSFKTHALSVNSNLGNLYDDAITLYNQEMDEMFLENYSVDVLRLYAPVDGVELSCKPLVWNAQEVVSELKDAIELNTLALKTSGSKQDYFLVDSSINSEARFINSKDWESFYEITPAEGSLLVSKPIGNQNGMGILGFCYVPYHFVYNVKYPVVIQLYKGEEFFQFPFVVVLQGNKPREALTSSFENSGENINLCSDKLASAQINLVNSNGEAVEGNVSYECFGSICDIGETVGGQLKAQFPQCVNGKLIIRSNGFGEYKETQTIVANNSQIIASLSKNLLINLDVIADGKSFKNNTIINFVSQKGKSSTVVYPDQKTVELSEGEYTIEVYLYGTPDFTLTANNTYKQCAGGYVLGIGQTCYDIQLPADMMKNALIGGGTTTYYFTENELEASDTLILDANELRIPKTLEDLQNNYGFIGSKAIEVSFK